MWGAPQRLGARLRGRFRQARNARGPASPNLIAATPLALREGAKPAPSQTILMTSELPTQLAAAGLPFPRVTKRAGAPDVILVVASDVERNAVSFLTDVRQGPGILCRGATRSTRHT